MNPFFTRRRLVLLLMLLVASAFAQAADYTVQHPASTLGFAGSFQGSAFKGRFDKWTADIRYDPAQLAQSKFDVTVDLASAATGDKDRDGALPGADFFDVAKFPKAHFVTRSFHKDGSKVIADGQLSLHGVTRPVSLVVDFKPAGAGATMDVSGTLKRLDFKIGGGDYADTSVIADEITVSAHLQLAPK